MPNPQAAHTEPDPDRARFRKVLAYIDAHIAEPLSVERLARVAAFSTHHFHRQFSALFDVGVYAYVQHVRLKRAADELGFHTWRSVLRVALESGYESPEAFARAFKKQLGQTPSQFRRAPDWRSRAALTRLVQRVRSDTMAARYGVDSVELIDFPSTEVVAYEHRGDPALVPQSVRVFIAWRRAHGLSPGTSATFNVFWSNAETVAPLDYRLDLCAATTRALPPNELGIVKKVIPRGRCAVLRHVGPDPLDVSIRYLYQSWLPASGESIRDYPLFARRVAFPPEVPEQESIVDIYLPLR
jgi:AraC family transcriptional regulator